MAAQRSRFFGSNNDYIQKYFYPKCLTNYSIIKNEFEQRITALSRNKNRNYYNEHNKIRNYIIEKNKELNSCYGDNLLRIKLIDDPDITSFLENCPSRSNCPRNRVSQVKKVVVPKHAAEDSCKKGGRSCNKELPGIKVEPGPNEGQRDAVVSSTRNSKVQDSIDPNLNHAKVDGLKQEDTTHAQPGIKTFGKSVDRESEASKPADNQNSSPVGHVELPKDLIHDLTHSAPTELGGQLIDSHSQGSSEHVPVSIDNSQEMSSDKNPDLKSPLSANTSDGQDSSAKPLETKDSKGDDSTTETLDTPVLSNTISGDSNSINQVTNDVTLHHVCTGEGCPNGAGDGEKRAFDAPVSGQAASPDVTHIEYDGNQEHGNSTTCHEPSCRDIPNDELIARDSEKSSIFDKFSNVIIKNKENVINTSIPMGIVLLLSLLFKYTPLWSILTKRKRKKQSHMNEKLQRVLQQPSIASEERSIPFSYSAFEYSS
ncbi:PIR protein [Plasmodium vivax]|nr:PIR protein [Plasmodium vivax]